MAWLKTKLFNSYCFVLLTIFLAYNWIRECVKNSTSI
jgi:regulatory protein YycI of two-component signal transduction system YycFG